jgi:hypothetical protein
MIYICIVIILIVLLLFYTTKIMSKEKEEFVTNFDQVLDKKCFDTNGSSLNNYLGPWDGMNGICGESTCPYETCKILLETIDGSFKNVSKYEQQILSTNSSNANVCTSKHNPPIVDCSNVILPVLDENPIICYQPICDGVGDDNKCIETSIVKSWRKQKFKNILNEVGVPFWKNMFKRDETYDNDSTELGDCIREPISCSHCNYFCCDNFATSEAEYCPKSYYPSGERIVDSDMLLQEVEHVLRKSTNNTFECKPNDVCVKNSNIVADKYCYNFDIISKQWTGGLKPYKNTIINNKKGFFYIKDDFIEEYPTTGCHASKTDMKTSYECSVNENIDCKFIDENGDLTTITYFSDVSRLGTDCEYRLLGEDSRYPDTLALSGNCPTNSLTCPDEDQYIKFYEIGSPKCEFCPTDTFRNSNYDDRQIYTESFACTPKPDCSQIDVTTSCLVAHNNNIQILKKEYLPRISKGNECVEKPNIREERNCLSTSEYISSQLSISNPIIIGNDTYYDNCEQGYQIDPSDNHISCKKEQKCNKDEKLNGNDDGCYVYNNTQDEYKLIGNDHITYANSTDIFSPCVLTSDETGQVIDKCIKICPVTYINQMCDDKIQCCKKI